jgi:hypothetical protein
MVFGVLEHWMEHQLRSHISTVASDMQEPGNELLWYHFSSVLSLVLSHQGRYVEASFEGERILKHLREKISSSGTADPMLYDMLRHSAQNLAAVYGKSGRHAEALALQNEALMLSQHSSKQIHQSEM